MKGHHVQQLIDSRKIFRFLNFLKDSGHPSYQFIEKFEDYERRCEETDFEGFLLMHPDYEFLEDFPTDAGDVLDEIIATEPDGTLSYLARRNSTGILPEKFVEEAGILPEKVVEEAGI